MFQCPLQPSVSAAKSFPTVRYLSHKEAASHLYSTDCLPCDSKPRAVCTNLSSEQSPFYSDFRAPCSCSQLCTQHTAHLSPEDNLASIMDSSQLSGSQQLYLLPSLWHPCPWPISQQPLLSSTAHHSASQLDYKFTCPGCVTLQSSSFFSSHHCPALFMNWGASQLP